MLLITPIDASYYNAKSLAPGAHFVHHIMVFEQMPPSLLYHDSLAHLISNSLNPPLLHHSPRLLNICKKTIRYLAIRNPDFRYLPPIRPANSIYASRIPSRPSLCQPYSPFAKPVSTHILSFQPSLLIDTRVSMRPHSLVQVTHTNTQASSLTH